LTSAQWSLFRIWQVKKNVNTIAKFTMRGAFIAAFTSENQWDDNKKADSAIGQ
jgi:hypothetical protein